MAYRRAEGVTYTDIEETGEAVLYVAEEERAIVVNGTAAIVWLLCDGTREPSEVARIMAGGLDGEVPPDHVMEIAEKLRLLGALES